MKIAIMEKTNFSETQINRLKQLGDVDFFDFPEDSEEAKQIAPNYDIVVVNWIDPSNFLLNMKSGSLVALLSTGYGWIKHMAEAAEKGVHVANIPAYSTESVAEHLLGLLLGLSKDIFSTLNKFDEKPVGYELKGKTVGIIGCGNIGSRFAEMMQFFGAKTITYNRTKKNIPNVKDVPLDTLLSESDIICISCAVNKESQKLINVDNYKKLKLGVDIIGSTWEIIEEEAITLGIKGGFINRIAMDAATEGAQKVSKALADSCPGRIFLTPHNAFNTVEAEKRQLDTCVSNIESFCAGIKKNIVN